MNNASKVTGMIKRTINYKDELFLKSVLQFALGWILYHRVHGSIREQQQQGNGKLRRVKLVATTNVYRSRDVKLDGYT